MSADFWAGYLSGALGILIGNPLDIIKVRLQANEATARLPLQHGASSFTTGTAGPLLGYGALNALLFVSYNRSEAALNEYMGSTKSLSATWIAGAIGGLATWVVSAPTEFVKCRAQAAPTSMSSFNIAKTVVKERGLKGLYTGGTVTALRDSIGYGFYFWTYQLMSSMWPASQGEANSSVLSEAPKVLLSGGIAGMATWASVFPLDVIKTRVQVQELETTPLLAEQGAAKMKPPGAWQLTKDAYRHGGWKVFFRGFGVCCARAFFVNAAQWAIYEAVMQQLQSTKSP
jgi:solute carrier family 25 (mitochondrial carnitine/acylcarnitine transporter), member 20/29